MRYIHRGLLFYFMVHANVYGLEAKYLIPRKGTLRRRERERRPMGCSKDISDRCVPPKSQFNGCHESGSSWAFGMHRSSCWLHETTKKDMGGVWNESKISERTTLILTSSKCPLPSQNHSRRMTYIRPHKRVRPDPRDTLQYKRMRNGEEERERKRGKGSGGNTWPITCVLHALRVLKNMTNMYSKFVEKKWSNILFSQSNIHVFFFISYFFLWKETQKKRKKNKRSSSWWFSMF